MNKQNQAPLPRAGRFVPSFGQFFFFYSSPIYLFTFVYSPHVEKQRRKTNGNKPRDAATPHGSTAAESVKNLLKKNPKYSKRINYDALKDLFVENGGPPSLAATMGIDDDKDDTELYRLDDKDDKSDGEGPTRLVVIEEGGTVATESSAPLSSKNKLSEVDAEGDIDAEGELDDGSDDEVALPSWEEAFEQEV